MKNYFKTMRRIAMVALFLVVNNPLISKAGRYVNYYTIQKNNLGYYEMVLDAMNGTTRTTLTLPLSGPDLKTKFGEYLMAAVSEALRWAALKGTREQNLFYTISSHSQGILFPNNASFIDFDFYLYIDNNSDIVLQLLDDWAHPENIKTIRLKNDATANQIAYFDYAVNTIIVCKYLWGEGMPTITTSNSGYDFTITIPGEWID